MLIDYIFISKSPGIAVSKYAVLSDSYNLKYPPKHLPVFVQVSLQKNEIHYTWLHLFNLAYPFFSCLKKEDPWDNTRTKSRGVELGVNDSIFSCDGN